MTLGLFSIEDKIAAIELEIKEIRKESRAPGSTLQRHYSVLKAICADLRARQDLPRNNALGDLGRKIVRMKAETPVGERYNEGLMIELAHSVIGRWPVISQALEQFGEESCE